MVRVANGLEELLDRPDGKPREQMIANAASNVEELRESSMTALEAIICDLEATLCDTGLPPQERVRKMQGAADRAITLAGTYGLTAMAETARRLCDLTMLGTNIVPDEAFAVCVRAMRLLTPPAKQPDPQGTENILRELEAIVTYFADLSGKYQT